MKNILIIDDTMTMAKMISQYLTEQGYQTIIANSGKSGIEKYTEHLPDLVLLDIEMPEMNGFDTLRGIKNALPFASHSPVVMLTAKSSKEVILKSIQEGASDYIVKPVNKQTLIEKVDKNLKKAG